MGLRENICASQNDFMEKCWKSFSGAGFGQTYRLNDTKTCLDAVFNI